MKREVNWRNTHGIRKQKTGEERDARAQKTRRTPSTLFLLVLSPVFCFVCFPSSEASLDSIIFRKESPELTFSELCCTKLDGTSKTHKTEKLPKPHMDKYHLSKTSAPHTPVPVSAEADEALRQRIRPFPGLQVS